MALTTFASLPAVRFDVRPLWRGWRKD